MLWKIIRIRNLSRREDNLIMSMISSLEAIFCALLKESAFTFPDLFRQKILQNYPSFSECFPDIPFNSAFIETGNATFSQAFLKDFDEYFQNHAHNLVDLLNAKTTVKIEFISPVELDKKWKEYCNRNRGNVPLQVKKSWKMLQSYRDFRKKFQDTLDCSTCLVNIICLNEDQNNIVELVIPKIQKSRSSDPKTTASSPTENRKKIPRKTHNNAGPSTKPADPTTNKVSVEISMPNANNKTTPRTKNKSSCGTEYLVNLLSATLDMDCQRSSVPETWEKCLYELLRVL